MPKGNPIIVGTRRAASIWLATFIVFSTTFPSTALTAQHAGATVAPSAEAEATSPKIHELLTLLADPAVQVWLKQQNETKSSAVSGQNTTEESVSQALDTRVAAIREHIVALALTVPDLPNQFWQGRDARYRGPR
jgi:hypothetical protein